VFGLFQNYSNEYLEPALFNFQGSMCFLSTEYYYSTIFWVCQLFFFFFSKNFVQKKNALAGGFLFTVNTIRVSKILMSELCEVLIFAAAIVF